MKVLSDELQAALLGVLRAWDVAGPYPVVHEAAKERLRDEWPTLYHAVNELSRVASGSSATR